MEKIVEVCNNGKQIQIFKAPDGENPQNYDYLILVDGISSHGNCNADDVIRYLGNCLEDGS